MTVRVKRWMARVVACEAGCPWTSTCACGTAPRDDQFIQLTEGGRRLPETLSLAEPAAGIDDASSATSPWHHGGRAVDATTRSGPGSCCPASRALHRARRSARAGTSTRPGASCSSAPTARTPGRTARPTCSRSAASRRATTRRCRGCSRRRGWAAWLETDGHGVRFELGERTRVLVRAAAGPLRVHLFTHATPLARLRAFLRLTGFPGAAAGVGLRASGRAATSTRTSATPRRTIDGYREHGSPLDAIVLDSPWETQYNTWEFNPHQFPDAAGFVSRAARATACGPSCG